MVEISFSLPCLSTVVLFIEWDRILYGLRVCMIQYQFYLRREILHTRNEYTFIYKILRVCNVSTEMSMRKDKKKYTIFFTVSPYYGIYIVFVYTIPRPFFFPSLICFCYAVMSSQFTLCTSYCCGLAFHFVNLFSVFNSISFKSKLMGSLQSNTIWMT